MPTLVVGTDSPVFPPGAEIYAQMTDKGSLESLNASSDNHVGDYTAIASVQDSEGSYTAIPSVAPTEVKDHAEGKKNKIPRPPNAYILYRRDHQGGIAAKHPGIKNNEISVIAGDMWNNESRGVRERYAGLAEEMRAAFYERYPGYKYKPRRGWEVRRRAKRPASRVKPVSRGEAVRGAKRGEQSKQGEQAKRGEQVASVQAVNGGEGGDQAVSDQAVNEDTGNVQVTDMQVTNTVQATDMQLTDMLTNMQPTVHPTGMNTILVGSLDSPSLPSIPATHFTPPTVSISCQQPWLDMQGDVCEWNAFFEDSMNCLDSLDMDSLEDMDMAEEAL